MKRIKVPFVEYDLISKACKGDMISVGTILGMYQGVVSAYFREHFSVLPEEGITECSQEMALVLMEALRGFNLEMS